MKKNIIKVLSFILLGSTLTSCLKDDSLILDPTKTNNVVEFANPSQIVKVGTIYPLYVLSYDYTSTLTTATVPVTVSYSGPEATAPQDITVNIAVGTEDQVNEYNEAGYQDDELTFMTPDKYKLASTTLVIKKGESKATTTILCDFTKFDLSEQAVLPLNITSASYGIISANFKTVLLNIGPKNIYDGVYRYQTSAATALRPNSDSDDAELVTSGPNSVKGHLLNYYSNEVVYTIDPATNTVITSMTSLLPIGNPGPSTYDPATKSFKLNWTSNGGARKFEETYTYIGSR